VASIGGKIWRLVFVRTILRHPHVGGDDLSSKNVVFLKIGVFQNSQTIQFGRIVYDLEGQFTMFIGYE